MDAKTKSELEGFFKDTFEGMPQKVALALHGVEAIFAGISTLSALGHHFSVIEGAATRVFEEFPKMLYSKDSQMVVDDAAAEAEALTKGFSATQQN